MFWADSRRPGPADWCSRYGQLGAVAAVAVAVPGAVRPAVAVADVVDAEFEARTLVALHMPPWYDESIRSKSRARRNAQPSPRLKITFVGEIHLRAAYVMSPHTISFAALYAYQIHRKPVKLRSRNFISLCLEQRCAGVPVAEVPTDPSSMSRTLLLHDAFRLPRQRALIYQMRKLYNKTRVFLYRNCR